MTGFGMQEKRRREHIVCGFLWLGHTPMYATVQSK